MACQRATGTDKAHLHVHVKPFNEWECECHYSEFAPPNAPDEPTRKQQYPPLATRIFGCMNFACFLPADSGAPAIEAEGPLLSARDAYADAIPVYREFTSNNTLLPDDALNADFKRLGTINGSKLGCYAVTGQYPRDGKGPLPDTRSSSLIRSRSCC